MRSLLARYYPLTQSCLMAHVETQGEHLDIVSLGEQEAVSDKYLHAAYGFSNRLESLISQQCIKDLFFFIHLKFDG